MSSRRAVAGAGGLEIASNCREDFMAALLTTASKTNKVEPLDWPPLLPDCRVGLMVSKKEPL
jgi:hypothetical protein